MPADNTDWSYTPLELVGAAPGKARDELDAWGIDPDWLGEQPQNVPHDDYRRFQYDKLYFYPVGGGGTSDETEIAPIEFRTYVYWIGEVPTTLEEHIKDTVNPRLRTLFDTGIYEGWMSGFNFMYHSESIERSASTQVARDEAGNLGVVQWEVLVLDPDSWGETTSAGIEGEAWGFADPFKLVERGPKHEVWRTTYNAARNSYEIRPRDLARQRLLGTRKEVYLNGSYIGNVVPSRGTIWLKKQYGTRDETYKDSHSGKQMWSRRKFIESMDIHPQEIRDNGRVYKVSETPSRIILISSRERAESQHDFDPTAEDEVDPSTVSEPIEMVTNDDYTTFSVRRDRGSKLGKYTPPTTRDISRETDWGTTQL